MPDAATLLLALVIAFGLLLLVLAALIVALAWASVSTYELDEDLDPAWWCDAT